MLPCSQPKNNFQTYKFQWDIFHKKNAYNFRTFQRTPKFNFPKNRPKINSGEGGRSFGFPRIVKQHISQLYRTNWHPCVRKVQRSVYFGPREACFLGTGCLFFQTGVFLAGEFVLVDHTSHLVVCIVAIFCAFRGTRNATRCDTFFGSAFWKK